MFENEMQACTNFILHLFKLIKLLFFYKMFHTSLQHGWLVTIRATEKTENEHFWALSRARNLNVARGEIRDDGARLGELQMMLFHISHVFRNWKKRTTQENEGVKPFAKNKVYPKLQKTERDLHWGAVGVLCWAGGICWLGRCKINWRKT